MEALDNADADIEQSALITRRLNVRKLHRGFHYSKRSGTTKPPKKMAEHSSSGSRQGPLSFSMNDDDESDDEKMV